jgi:hypothetical protein
MADKIYIGSGKSRFFTDGGEVIGFWVSREDVAKINANLNAQGGINIDICKRREVGKKGQTHYGQLNNWQPDGKRASKPSSAPTAEWSDGGAASDKGEEDQPF